MFTVDEKTESFIASGDLSNCLGRIVQLLPNADLIVGLGAANLGYGVLLNAPKDKEEAAVVIEGVTMVRVGAAVQAGDRLTTAASGWGITAAVTAGKQSVIGTALTGAASGMLAPTKLERFYLPNSIA